LVSFSQEKQKILFFPLFLVVGLEKVALPSFLFWQLEMQLATLTWLRVLRDSAAHEAELGRVNVSVDRGQKESLDGPRQ
jgi:hypothetical protein